MRYLQIGAALAFALLAGTAPAQVVAPQARANETSSDALAPPDAASAPIALMVDMASGQVLHSREADRRFVPASITKVMTMFLAFELLEDGRIDLRQRMPVRDETYLEWSGTGSSMGIGRGEQISVHDLLRGISTVSANDGAVVLAEGTAGSTDEWVAMMNAKAREIGMHDSHFGTPNGWPDEGATFVTARDLATLARAMILRHPERYRAYFGHRSFTYREVTQNNHDPITGVVAGADGIKTGYTRQAGYGFLGSAERDGQRLIMVVGAVPNIPARNRAARGYMEWGFANFDRDRIFGAGDVIGEGRVRGGAQGSVPLALQIPVTVARRAEADPQVGLQLVYDGPIPAPIAAGDRVASLRMTIDGQSVSDVPLVATQDVPRGGTLDRLRDGFYNLLQ